VAVPELHPKAAFDHQKHFVFIFVMVKNKIALDLVELDVLSIQLGRDIGLPVFGDLRKLFGQIYFFHKNNSLSSDLLGMKCGASKDDAPVRQVAGIKKPPAFASGLLSLHLAKSQVLRTKN
jgi:hypothetical protein